MGNRRRVAERRKTKPVVIGGMIAVVLGGGGFGAYALFGGGAAADDGTRAARDQKSEVKTGPLSPAEVTNTARAFLTAWQSGKVTRAAAATDDAAAAAALLTGYTKDAGIKDVTLTPGRPTGDKVPFSVKGTVSYKGTEKPLAYDSALTVVRRAGDGKPLVDWHAAVVHPDLKDGDELVTGEAGTPPVKALDRDGGELTKAKYASIGPILDGLREKYGKEAGGKAGIELRVVRGKAAKAKDLSDKTLLELSEG
ncbi:NTF2-like N-terminal transpeptidase domain-containing protein, partial [Streptomyces cellulosae]